MHAIDELAATATEEKLVPPAVPVPEPAPESTLRRVTRARSKASPPYVWPNDIPTLTSFTLQPSSELIQGSIRTRPQRMAIQDQGRAMADDYLTSK